MSAFIESNTTPSTQNPLAYTQIVEDLSSVELSGYRGDGSNYVAVSLRSKNETTGKPINVRDWCIMIKGVQYKLNKSKEDGVTGMLIPLTPELLASLSQLEKKIGEVLLKTKNVPNNLSVESAIKDYYGTSALKLKFRLDAEKNNTLFRDETCAKDSYLSADAEEDYSKKEINYRHPTLLRMSAFEQTGRVNLLVQPNGANIVSAKNQIFPSWNIKMLYFNGKNLHPDEVTLSEYSFNSDLVVSARDLDVSKVSTLESKSTDSKASLENYLYNYGFNPLAGSKKLLIQLPENCSTMGIEKVKPYNPNAGKPTTATKKPTKSKTAEAKEADKYRMQISFQLNDQTKQSYQNLLAFMKSLDQDMKTNFSTKTKGGVLKTTPAKNQPDVFESQTPFMTEPKLSKKGDATYVNLKLTAPTTYEIPIFDDNGAPVSKDLFVNPGVEGSMKPLPFRVNVIVSPVLWYSKSIGYGIKLSVARIETVTKKSENQNNLTNHHASVLDDDDEPQQKVPAKPVDLDDVVVSEDEEDAEDEDVDDDAVNEDDE